ncbi:Phosphoserine phosphatase RsbU [Anaerohalosphaera lusitana]|uniref:Phosphoserine phosphatase RsbU n=1 Tax=Anaerohalosphaera lusitana TaxID=1936003 RepID=A0A1U9NHL6_9BACT|nr:GAF domain-containing SpoIIE family protein phosphatase [Anaerohalosphaera lusitana]AQT67409.1 Phosphoserine phosphatase RsbU [Anaerohalosphaera lusitana]
MLGKTNENIELDKILDMATMVAGDFSLQEVLDRLAEAAVKITSTTACSIRLLDEESGDLAMRSTYGLSESWRNKGPVTREDPVVKEAFSGQAVVLDDMRVDGRSQYPQAIADEGLVSQLTVAMTFKNKPIGVLRLYSPEPRRFDEDSVAIARLVATQCAIAITNAKLYSRAIRGAKVSEQMRLGAVIQRRMIPNHAPKMCGLDVAATYQPCFEIGGDLYDFIKINDHTIAIGIADVIGKGIPAAMMMSLFRGAFRAYADKAFEKRSMSEIVDKLNKVAYKECRNGEFITLFFGYIDIDKMEMTYCNCGHEPGLLMRGGKTRDLNTGGLVLGVLEDAHYDIETVKLQDHDSLLLYTDGLIDAMDFDGELWGKERMLEVLDKCVDCSAGQLIKNLLAYRRRFVGLASQVDDTSLVAVKVNTCDCDESS